MQLAQFDYRLPAERIAQEPADRRDDSRLMVLRRQGGPLEHRRFADLVDLLVPGDVIVVNDTRVIPARLYGRKGTGGKAELLLDRPLEPGRLTDGRQRQEWACLVRSAKPLRAGQRVQLPGGGEAESLGAGPQGGHRIRLCVPGTVLGYLQHHGRLPLPAYVRRGERSDPRDSVDRRRYQTVYAKRDGAVAAPTAGLHFTDEILRAVCSRGVEIVALTLHVGPGTFLPVRSENIDEHRMHPERYALSESTARAVSLAKREGRRVVAVGTTVVRALESSWDDALGGPRPGEALTDRFIRPGDAFQAVDVLLTNFHLPRSTLLMLVCAFADRQRVLAAYREAIEQGYRFYSYGDAMLLI